ncbi:hypothetical protein NPIL_477561 [Nephila pilipes]|uniref:Uncharacterized protein n=1 Tax=Nephila pilipes TaxID=299642 RepID=A0A8X6PVH7_NEPPI|nr:hypothetical protein NPIL_477561 [Nephila pilipes]
MDFLARGRGRKGEPWSDHGGSTTVLLHVIGLSPPSPCLTNRPRLLLSPPGDRKLLFFPSRSLLLLRSSLSLSLPRQKTSLVNNTQILRGIFFPPLRSNVSRRGRGRGNRLRPRVVTLD